MGQYAYPDFRLPDVFSKGNTKLGRDVLTFSLPVITTCPGSSSVCRDLCYADRAQSRFSTPAVRRCYEENLELSKRDDFHLIVTDLLSRPRRDNIMVRLHVSGDYYDEAYARKWLYVVGHSPRITFWCYTRSWRVPAIRPVLEELGGMPNMSLWYSCDKETGRPVDFHPAIRLAYMRIAESDKPAYTPDLYFREHAIRKTVEKHVGGTLVCPPENGVSHSVRCTSCRICVVRSDDTAKRTKDRFPLEVL
jgi:hypothetical protein